MPELSLSYNERTQLLCQTDKIELVRVRTKKQWHLQCPQCKVIWSESFIRSGKAKGLIEKGESNG